MKILISLIVVTLLVLAGSFLMWMYLLKGIVDNPINNKEKLLSQLFKGSKNDDNFFF